MAGRYQRAIIICGFVSIGKTTLASLYPCHWPYHRVYHMGAIRDQKSLSYADYVERIKTLAAEPDAIIIVGTQQHLRRRLQAEGLIYVRVYPGPMLQGEWCRRQWSKHGEDAGRLLRQRWGTWIRETGEDFAGEISTKSFQLGSREYLLDLMPEIVEWFRIMLLVC